MKLTFPFHPKLWDCLRNYNLKVFQADVMAGLTVGIIALPLAMAFAIASGVKPEAGLITAIIAGFLTSFFGGSRVAIGGPTGAFIVIVLGIVTQYGVPNLLICTIMAGVILFLMGLTRMGALIRYIPYPLISGFTAGIAVLIFLSQIKDFLGLKMTVEPGLLGTISSLAPHIQELHWPTFIMAAACLAGIYLWPKRIARFFPGTIAMLVIATAATALFNDSMGLGIATIGSQFNGIPQNLPPMQIPTINIETFKYLLAPAITIALLGAIESLLCAVVADGMIDDEHDPDQELMAQGIANIITPLFGGIPATGAIARTAANIRNGGRTPVAGIIHAGVLLVIILAAAPLAKHVPLPVLSAILITVAFNMADWRELKYLFRFPKSDITVYLTTFILTIIFDLTVAVEAGMIIACVLFIKRMSEQAGVEEQIIPMKMFYDNPNNPATPSGPTASMVEPLTDVLVVRVTGAMFFGAASKLKNVLLYLKREPLVVIIKMQQVISLDATTLIILDEIIEKCLARGIAVVVCSLQPQPRLALKRAKILEKLPPENICADLDCAIARAEKIIEGLENTENTNRAA